MTLEKRLETLMSQHDQETYWKWIQACFEVIDDIDNEWENRFIKDIYRKMDGNRNFFLTPKQIEILERVYAQYTK